MIRSTLEMFISRPFKELKVHVLQRRVSLNKYALNIYSNSIIIFPSATQIFPEVSFVKFPEISNYFLFDVPRRLLVSTHHSAFHSNHLIPLHFVLFAFKTFHSVLEFGVCLTMYEVCKLRSHFQRERPCLNNYQIR